MTPLRAARGTRGGVGESPLRRTGKGETVITDTKARVGPWAEGCKGKTNEPSPSPPSLPPSPPAPFLPQPQTAGPREKAKPRPPSNPKSMRNEVRQVPREMLSFIPGVSPTLYSTTHPHSSLHTTRLPIHLPREGPNQNSSWGPSTFAFLDPAFKITCVLDGLQGWGKDGRGYSFFLLIGVCGFGKTRMGCY